MFSLGKVGLRIWCCASLKICERKKSHDCIDVGRDIWLLVVVKGIRYSAKVR